MLSPVKPIVDALLAAGFERTWFEAKVPRIERMRDGKLEVEYGAPIITLKFTPEGLTKQKLAQLILPLKATRSIHITLYQRFSADGRHEVLWYATRITYEFERGGLTTYTIFEDNAYSISTVMVGDVISYLYMTRDLTL